MGGFLLFLGLAVDGAATLLTALAPFFALAVAFKVLSGLGNSLEYVAADTTLQRVVERPMLGRVFGVFYGGMMLAEALGAVLGGVLVEISSACVAFLIAGVAALAVTLIVWRLLPRRGGAV
jgi:predicted MFS family arabinose efflux permease